MRPLALIEERAQFKVQEYAKKAMEARLLWREIRGTHPGKNCYEHCRYPEFSKIRQERNILADEITSNRALYKNFISKIGQELGLGWKALNNQAIQCNNFIKDRLKIEEMINDTARKYHLKNSTFLSSHDYLNQIYNTFERIKNWNNTVDKINSDKDSTPVLFEQAIIAEIIRNDIKKEYCFLLTPEASVIRSQGIAFIASSLIQQSSDLKNYKDLLESAMHSYDKNNDLKEFLIKDHQKSHSKIPLDKAITPILRKQIELKQHDLNL